MKLFTAFFLCFSIEAYGQVRIADNGDMLKGKVKKMTEYIYNEYESGNAYATLGHSIVKDTFTRIYTCDTANKFEFVSFCNEKNFENIWALMVVPKKAMLKFDNKGYLTEHSYFSDLDSLYMKKMIRYDNNCRKIEEREVRYPFHTNQPVEYSDENIEVRDSTGDYCTYQYDNAGDMIQKTQEVFWGTNRTLSDTTVYKYDSLGNKIEEDDFKSQDSSSLIMFYRDGKTFTTKTIFKYDSLNRLSEKVEYFKEKPHAIDSSVLPFLPSSRHLGTRIGEMDLYTYNGQQKKAVSRTSMSIFQRDDGSIVTDNETTVELSKTKTLTEYDKKGNVIKKKDGDKVVLERIIEYY